MTIGALGNSSNVFQADMNAGDKKISAGDTGNIKTLYGDPSKASMLSAHMSEVNDTYAAVKAMIDSRKNELN